MVRDAQTIAERFRFVQALGHITRYHAQMSAMAITTRMKLRYAMNGPSMVSQAPPRPMIDSPIGNTQQEADSNARRAAIGMTSFAVTPDSVAVC